MRVFPQKPQYVLVSNAPSHQKRTNPFNRAEKLGIALVLILFLTYLVIFMQAVFNYFQQNHIQNISTQAHTHINPNSVQQGYSLDNISSGYPSFVAIPKAPIKDQVDLYNDLINNSDRHINADHIVHQLDKTVSDNNPNSDQTTQLAKLDKKQDRPKAPAPQESALPSEPKTSHKDKSIEDKPDKKVSKQTPPKRVIVEPKKEEKPRITVKETPKPNKTVEKSTPEPKKPKPSRISTEQSPPALVKTEKTTPAPAPTPARTKPSTPPESFSVLEQSLGL